MGFLKADTDGSHRERREQQGRFGRWLLPAVTRGAGLQAALQTSSSVVPIAISSL